MDSRITVLARNIPHRNYAVARTGIIPLVFLCHFVYALAPCIMEFAGIGVDDVIIRCSCWSSFLLWSGGWGRNSRLCVAGCGRL